MPGQKHPNRSLRLPYFCKKSILNTQYITILDYILLPFVLALVYGIAYSYRNKHYGWKHPWRKYFIPALSVKIFGAIFIGLIYQFYYGMGDTLSYFNHSLIINSAWNESPAKWWNLVWHIPGKSDGDYFEYMAQLYWYNDRASYSVAAITAVISLVVFKTYLPAAVLMAAIAFTGVWALFRCFASLYPTLLKPIAVATLFIPSTFVWGSGIFKDTLCLFALGWLTYGVFRLLIKKDFSVQNILIVLLSAWLISRVKLYILVSFVPALTFWLLFIYLQNVKDPAKRFVAKFSMLAVMVGVFFILTKVLSDQLGNYSLENIAGAASATSDWITYASGDEGASYSLGAFDPSIGGMLVKLPLAIVTTFFRPFPWEAGKVIVMLSALEALLFAFITLRLLFSVGLKNTWRTINADPTIQFCFIFALIFGFAIAISTGNFGALSRYKIPALPFYALGICLVWYKNMGTKKRLLPFL